MSGSRAADRRRVRRFAAAAATLLPTASGRAEGAGHAAVPSGPGLPAALMAWVEAVPRAAWYWIAAGMVLATLAGALAGLLMSRGRSRLPRVPAAAASPPAARDPAPPAAGRWELTGWDAAGPHLRARFGPLDLARASDGLVLGRSPELCHLVTRNRTVSRRHVRFTIREGALMVEDLNSASGTLLEGRRLQPMKPVPIRDGDTLALGDFLLRLSDHA